MILVLARKALGIVLARVEIVSGGHETSWIEDLTTRPLLPVSPVSSWRSGRGAGSGSPRSPTQPAGSASFYSNQSTVKVAVVNSGIFVAKAQVMAFARPRFKLISHPRYMGA